MTTYDFHTLVEQDVQKISSFAYQDLLPEEIDIQANKSFLQYLNDFVDFQPKGNRLNDTEARLNDIRTLIVKDFPIGAVVTGSVSVAFLPNNYLYHLGLKADVYKQCNAVTELLPNKFYLLTVGSYVIDGANYIAGSIVSPLSKMVVPKDTFVRLQKSIVPCRIVSNANKTELESHYYGKTTADSPLGVIVGNQIQIDLNGFLINRVQLYYIRKPKTISFSLPNDEIDLSLNGQYKLAALTVQNIKAVTERRIQNQ